MAAVATYSPGIFEQLSPLDANFDVWLDETLPKKELVEAPSAGPVPLEVLLVSQQILIENHGVVESRLREDIRSKDDMIATLRAQLFAANAARDRAISELARTRENADTDAKVHKTEFVRMRSEMGRMDIELKKSLVESETAQVYAQHVRKENISIKRALTEMTLSSSQQIQTLLDQNARLERELKRVRGVANLDLDREIRDYAERRVNFDGEPSLQSPKRQPSSGHIPAVRSAPGPIHH